MTSLYAWHREHFTISTDKALLDLDTIHAYLYRSYWSPGIPRDAVATASAHSFCFGLYDDQAGKQIGFARAITDFTAIAYLADIFVLPAYQGKGLGVWLIDCIMQSPPLDGLRSIMLSTRDAHHLYSRFGFKKPDDPNRMMVARSEMSWYRPDLAETYEGTAVDE